MSAPPTEPTQDEPGSVTTSEEVTPTKTAPSWRRGAVEWVVILGVAVVAALIIRLFFIQPFFIPSGSMEPTLDVNDRVLVDKISYDLHSVHRGDIIVFAKPADDNTPGIKDLIKRVIGLPGETIQSGPNSEIFINGHLIKQPWLTAAAKADPGPPVPLTHIPSGDYWVMGDNRGDSADSRSFGPISGHLIVGRAFLTVWPLNRIGTL